MLLRPCWFAFATVLVVSSGVRKKVQLEDALIHEDVPFHPMKAAVISRIALDSLKNASNASSLTESGSSVLPPNTKLGPILTRIPEWARLVTSAVGIAIRIASQAANNLQDGDIATIVLSRWLGMDSPTRTIYNGAHRNILSLTYSGPFTEQLHIILLCKTVVHILENAHIEHGTQDPDNNDCLTNPANAEPYAYTKRSQNNGKKGDRYQIYVCSHGFIASRQAQELHDYKTVAEQLAAFLIHEAFHQATHPLIEDKGDCLWKNSALWCVKCGRKIDAQNNGFNYQYLVTQAAHEVPIKQHSDSHLICGGDPWRHPDWLDQELKAVALQRQKELALARAKVRQVIYELMTEEASEAQAAGLAAEAQKLNSLAGKVHAMKNLFLQQAEFLRHGETANAGNQLALARSMYSSMKHTQQTSMPNLVVSPETRIVQTVVPVVQWTYRQPEVDRYVQIPQQRILYFG